MFHLRKWYFDAVDAQGRVVIGYAAWLRLGVLRWRYSGLLVRQLGCSATTRSKFGAAREPSVHRDGVDWACEELGVTGRWRATSGKGGVRRTLAPGVDWDAVLPSSHAEVEICGERWSGVGYVECMEMRVPPWRLPIDELRWGRWIGERTSIVWIEWKQRETMRCVICDGCTVACASLGDREVRGESWNLELQRDTTLREGELGKTVLSTAPCLKRLSPVRMVQTREEKWLSRGMLTSERGVEHGWAVHEVVAFGPGHERRVT